MPLAVSDHTFTHYIFLITKNVHLLKHKHLVPVYQHGFTAHRGWVLSAQAQEQILSPHTLLQDYFIPERKG